MALTSSSTSATLSWKTVARFETANFAYATFGRLSPQRDNAILILTAYSDTSKITEQAYIGLGRAIDPDKYFIIIANQIGNGLSSSPHNTPDRLTPL
jgi:homoserine O-acetyltransferase